MRFLVNLLNCVPLRWVHAIGAGLGWIVYWAAPRYRRRLRENLRAAGWTDDATRRAAVAEAGKSIAELPLVWFGATRHTLAWIREFRGMALIEAAMTSGRGILFLTPHLGCFELLPVRFALMAPVTVLYRPSKLRWVETIMESGRSRDNVRLAPTNLAGVRKLLRALRAHEAIGLLPDQVPGFGEGEWIDFFGRPAYTMTLLARLHAATDPVVLIVHAERLPRGAGFRVHVHPLPVDEPQIDARQLLSKVNRALEAVIRTCPSQYLWAYNRYKVPAGAPPPPEPARSAPGAGGLQ